jgi:hypothetical protein
LATSQNSYPANNKSLIHSVTVPGGTIAVRKGPAGDLLIWFATQFHQHVEALEWPGNWGYAERPIRGSSTVLSNHASGTAIDLNAPQHPLGSNPTSNFTTEQISTIRLLLGRMRGAIRWGGDYSGRKDPMHFEVIVSERRCQTILAELTGTTVPAESLVTGALKVGSKGPAVAALQGLLNRMFPAYSKLVVDGDFGPATETVVKEFQRRSGLNPDGIVGPLTKSKLGF